MTTYRALLVIAFFSVSALVPSVVAAEMTGVVMKAGKMMMMQDGKVTGPMDHEMTTTTGHRVMPDGTMTMPDGKEMRMKEGQMMTMDGKMMEGGKAKTMGGMKGM
jgi:hypothetical protein